MILPKYAVFLFLFLCAIAKRVDSTKMGYKKTCICPDTKKSTKGLEEIYAMQKKLSNDLFARKIPNLSCLGNEYFTILKKMLNGDNFYHTFTTSVLATWLSTLQPYLDQKPDGCAMAGMINATVAFLKNYDSEPMMKALEEMNKTLLAITDIMPITAKIVSGCTCEPGVPKSLKELIVPRIAKCFGNGYVYDIEEIWQLKGKRLPKQLAEVVLKLYKSCDFVDNYLALIASFAILPMNGADRFVNNSLQEPLELTYLGLSPKLPYCCCESHLKRIEELTQGTKRIALKVIETEYKIFSPCPYERYH